MTDPTDAEAIASLTAIELLDQLSSIATGFAIYSLVRPDPDLAAAFGRRYVDLDQERSRRLSDKYVAAEVAALVATIKAEAEASHEYAVATTLDETADRFLALLGDGA